MDYIISTDSSADVDRDYLDARDISVINYSYEIDGKEYIDDGGVSLSYEDFYQAMASGSSSKTAAINSDQYKDYFKIFLEDGKDVIHIMLGSKLSSSYSHALMAKADLEEAYPGRKVYIIDSMAASWLIGLMLIKAADLRDEGWPAGDLALWLEENKTRVSTWFLATDMDHYVRGGRISAPVGWLGGKIKICPIMTIDGQGKGKIQRLGRSMNKGIDLLVDKFTSDGLKSEPVVAFTSNMPDMRARLKDRLLEKNPQIQDQLILGRIGTTVGSHTGGKTLALAYWTEKARDHYQ